MAQPKEKVNNLDATGSGSNVREDATNQERVWNGESREMPGSETYTLHWGAFSREGATFTGVQGRTIKGREFFWLASDGTLIIVTDKKLKVGDKVASRNVQPKTNKGWKDELVSAYKAAGFKMTKQELDGIKPVWCW